MLAEILRHGSLESAREYAHPTPEAKTDVLESSQGGIIVAFATDCTSDRTTACGRVSEDLQTLL
jgi:hypothetical protein